jgi:hypothetical protein
LKKTADILDPDDGVTVIGHVYPPEGRYYVSVKADILEVTVVRIAHYLQQFSVDSSTVMAAWGFLEDVLSLAEPHGVAAAPGSEGMIEAWMRRGIEGWNMVNWVPLTVANPLDLNAAIYDDWRKFIAGEFTGQIFDFMLVFKAPIETVTPVARFFQYTIDVPERTVRLDNVSLPIGVPVIVTFDPPFYAVPAVGITIKALTAADAYTQSAVTVSGFTITMTNRTAIVDIAAEGWGRSQIAMDLGKLKKLPPPTTRLGRNRSNKQLSRWRVTA